MHTRQQNSGNRTEAGKTDREGENRSAVTSSRDFRTNESNQGQ